MESSVPVVVRFSDFTGLPNIPDTEVKANPRGFAIKFLLSDGSNMDIVNHSFNGFPVSTSSEFSALLEAIASSGGESTPGSELEEFLGSHPIAKTFLTTQTQLPQSWATTSFYSVNAVQFTDAEGRGRTITGRARPPPPGFRALVDQAEGGRHERSAATAKRGGVSIWLDDLTAGQAYGQMAGLLLHGLAARPH
jgi:catalase